MSFTTLSSQPEQNPSSPMKYSPVRTSPSAHGNTAPVPHAGDPVTQVGLRPPESAASPAPEGVKPEEGPADQNVDLARRLAIVARKDRLVRQRAEAAQAAEKRAQEALTRLEARELALSQTEQRRSEWRKNPKLLLQEHGFVPEAALQYMLNGEKLSPEQALAAQMDVKLAEERAARESEMKAFAESQEERRKAQEAADAKANEAALGEQERFAVQELHADIGDIIDGDQKGYPVLRKARGGGIAAVYERVQQLSDQIYQESGRRPPLTTKLLERAAHDVEAAATKELQETLSDPDIGNALGINRQQPQRPQRPQTLTNALRPAQQQPPAQETAAEKRERVKAMIQPFLNGGRAR